MVHVIIGFCVGFGALCVFLAWCAGQNAGYDEGWQAASEFVARETGRRLPDTAPKGVEEGE